MKLLQIVPGFGMTRNGLYDYAKVLEIELLKRNVSSIYSFDDVIDADAVFLNYSGYGYQKRGLPVNLYLQLRQLVKTKRIPLFIYFHELYAGGTHPTTSSFWLYPLQKKLCHLFLKLSTVSFCGNDVMLELLQRGMPEARNKIFYAGLFSNIPVLQENRLLEMRENVAVVFGSEERREALYKNFELIEKVCHSLGIIKIIDIGSGNMNKYCQSKKIVMEARGALAPNEVASALQKSRFGFISYPEHLFGKSGIFAAYAGNGMMIINFWSGALDARDGLKRGFHYLNAMELNSISIMMDQRIADHAFQWYQSRNAMKHSAIIYDKLIQYVPASHIEN